MATITERRGRYRALVRRKELGAPLCATFDTRRDAEDWAAIQEGKIAGGEDPGAGKDVTVTQAIGIFRRIRNEGNPVEQHSSLDARLNTIGRLLGTRMLAKADFSWLREFGSIRIDEGVSRSTVQQEIGTLGTVMREVGAELKAKFPDIVNRASRRKLRTNYRLIGKGRERNRRPQPGELERILAHLPAEYHKATLFAARSAMRRGEICALLRADLHRAEQTILVRGRKHPDDDERDMEVPLLLGAYEILISQLTALPEGEARVFPIDGKEWEKAWRKACKAAGVKDLRIHDLRHEAISALFEAGYEIQEVVLVSGHLTWEQLRRYTNLSPRELKHGPAKVRRLKLAA